MLKNLCVFALFALVGGMAAGTAHADIEKYSAVMLGENEVDPVVTDAGGVATIIVNTETLQAAWAVEFAELSSAQTMAHFHNAPAGANGPAIFTLPVGSPIAGVWSMTAGEYAELSAGNIYINVHTENFPAGEIRGQLMLDEVVVSTDETTFGSVKSLYR
jgi:hypothetical protein